MRDASGDAVDEEPASALPEPAWSVAGFGGENVVEAKDAADDEEAVGDVVGGAGSVFLQVRVDIKRADFEVEGLVLAGADVPLGRGPFAEGDNVGFGDGCGQGREDEDRKQGRQFSAHGLR